MNTTDSGFLAESYPTVKFPEIGSTYKGRLVAVNKREDRDIDGTLRTFDNGDPMHVFVWQVVDSNGDTGNIWVKGNLYAVLKEACKETGAKCDADMIGATLQIKHHQLGEGKKGKNPPKLFQAKVTLMDAADRPAFLKQFADTPVNADEYDPFPEG